MRATKTLPATILASLLPLFAQDYRDLHASIGEFKALSGEVVKANPLLATGAGAAKSTTGGVDSLLTGLGLKEAPPPPVRRELRLSKEQQAIVDAAIARRAKQEAAKAVAPADKHSVSPKTAAAKTAPRAAAPSPVAAMPVIKAEPAKPEPNKVKEESARAITVGMGREQLLASLGQPKSLSAITGLEDGPRETLTWELESGQLLFVKVAAGKVLSVSR